MFRSGLKPQTVRRRGAVAVMVAFFLIIFIAMATFAIDTGYMQLVRTELRASTDAAARAGAEALSRTQNAQLAKQAAISTAALNTVAGQPLVLEDEDVVFGMSTRAENGKWIFTPNVQPYNAIRIHGRRTATSANGEVPLLLGSLLGVPTFGPERHSTASQLDRDIVLVLDRSGSMAFDMSGVDWSYPADYVYPSAYCLAPHPTLSRWAAAAAALTAFLDELEDTTQIEYVSLVTYASAGTWCSKSHKASTVEVGLTSDYLSVSSAMASRSAKAIPGGTSISSGLNSAIDVLKGNNSRPLAAKTIVLMTDGVHNSGPSPLTSATTAKNEGITIHTITFSDGAAQADMKAVAAKTGGNHYHAPDAATLAAIFREVALTLPVVLSD